MYYNIDFNTHREFDIHLDDIETLLTPLSKLDGTQHKKNHASSSTEGMEDIGPKFLDMYSSIYAMREDLENIRKPSGSRENPVRCCKDLYLGHPNYEDGKHYFN